MDVNKEKSIDNHNDELLKKLKEINASKSESSTIRPNTIPISYLEEKIKILFNNQKGLKIKLDDSDARIDSLSENLKKVRNKTDKLSDNVTITQEVTNNAYSKIGDVAEENSSIKHSIADLIAPMQKKISDFDTKLIDLEFDLERMQMDPKTISETQKQNLNAIADVRELKKGFEALKGQMDGLQKLVKVLSEIMSKLVSTMGQNPEKEEELTNIIKNSFSSEIDVSSPSLEHFNRNKDLKKKESMQERETTDLAEKKQKIEITNSTENEANKNTENANQKKIPELKTEKKEKTTLMDHYLEKKEISERNTVIDESKIDKPDDKLDLAESITSELSTMENAIKKASKILE